VQIKSDFPLRSRGAERRSVIAIATDRTQALRRFEVSCALSVVPVRPVHNNDDGLKLVKHRIRERRRNAAATPSVNLSRRRRIE